MTECIQTNAVFYIWMLAGALVPFIPFIGNHIGTVNTLLHELAHAFFSLLTSGEVEQIVLSGDASGMVKTKSKYWIGKFMTTISGYTVASVCSPILFWLYINHGFIWIFYFFTSLSLVALVLWVRNVYGMLWLALFIALLCWGNFYGSTEFKASLMAFLSGVILVKSVSSTLTLFILSVKTPAKAGDATVLKQITYVPAVVWSIFFVLFACWMTWISIKLMPCFQEVYQLFI